MPNKSWLPAWADRGRDVEHFGRFKGQVDSLFEDWFGRSMGGVLAPRMDVAEDETSVTPSRSRSSSRRKLTRLSSPRRCAWPTS